MQAKIQLLSNLRLIFGVNVKYTPFISEEEEINDIIMQGKTLSGIICTNSIDKMSKDKELEPLKYKDAVDIPTLGFVDDIVDVNDCGEKTEEANKYTTNEMNKRRLQLSKDKCAKMHIGRKRKTDEITHKCSEVKIDNWKVKKKKVGDNIVLEDEYQGEVEIKEVQEYEYLGDIVLSNGSCTKNVKKRIAKGYGMIREIKEILENTFFGSYYIEALILLRNSMLISVLTYNLEVSPKLSKTDIKQLEEVDLKLLRESLSLSSKSSKTLIYAELGLLSVEYILKKKRLLYLHNLLTRPEENLARKVLLQMINIQTTGDWIQTVNKDLKDFQLLLDYDQISNISKPSFKKIVVDACRETYFKNICLSKQKLSKGSEICYVELKLQMYLKSSQGLSIEIMKRILSIRFSWCL